MEIEPVQSQRKLWTERVTEEMKTGAGTKLGGEETIKKSELKR
jgi:hypothetical protein